MTEKNWDSFQEKLDETHQWPCQYTFKCVIRAEYYCELEKLKVRGEHSIRQSKGGKYLSFTLQFEAQSSDDVLSVYREASAIPGAVLL
ncbi:MAG: DUF493 domain-containing protein [Verrucomicrobiota bacterium]